MCDDAKKSESGPILGVIIGNPQLLVTSHDKRFERVIDGLISSGVNELIVGVTLPMDEDADLSNHDDSPETRASTCMSPAPKHLENEKVRASQVQQIKMQLENKKNKLVYCDLEELFSDEIDSPLAALRALHRKLPLRFEMCREIVLVAGVVTILGNLDAAVKEHLDRRVSNRISVTKVLSERGELPPSSLIHGFCEKTKELSFVSETDGRDFVELQMSTIRQNSAGKKIIVRSDLRSSGVYLMAPQVMRQVDDAIDVTEFEVLIRRNLDSPPALKPFTVHVAILPETTSKNGRKMPAVFSGVKEGLGGHKLPPRALFWKRRELEKQNPRCVDREFEQEVSLFVDDVWDADLEEVDHKIFEVKSYRLTMNKSELELVAAIVPALIRKLASLHRCSPEDVGKWSEMAGMEPFTKFWHSYFDDSEDAHAVVFNALLLEAVGGLTSGRYKEPEVLVRLMQIFYNLDLIDLDALAAWSAEKTDSELTEIEEKILKNEEWKAFVEWTES